MYISRRELLLAGVAWLARSQDPTPFPWPEGKRAAVSLTFDDARVSQIDTGIALLDRHGVKATFYVNPGAVQRRLAGWREVVAAGRHEIGNHSYSHPCSANLAFSRANALEDYTLSRMEEDIDRCTAELRRLLDVTPVSFAYPCGQDFVGRGESTRSYVPVVAKRFLTGRGFRDRWANDPRTCDLANLTGVDFDGWTFDRMREFVENAATEHRWAILAGHEIGVPRHQSVIAEELERFCKYLTDPANGIWTGTVAEIAGYVQAHRRKS